MSRPRSILWVVAVNILLAVCLLEITLRVQQKIGPLYDLDLRPESMLVDASDELNHVHPTGIEWDSNGIRRMDEPNSERCAARLLFLGDSFMEGLSSRDTIPYHVRRILGQFGQDVCIFNGGTSSYSPSIFVAQAKKLIPLLKPDLVIVDVDETDIYDEWYRYRDLVVRDDTGSVQAVLHSPITTIFQRGLLASTDKPLYLQRLVAKLYFTRFEYPPLYSEHMQNKTVPIFMSALQEGELYKAYGEQISHFSASLDDLTQSVIRLTGGPDKLVYIHHPHLQHLGGGKTRYNNIVSATLRAIASRHNVSYYDAADDLKARFGNAPEAYYIRDDIHFNAAGLQAYATFVASFLSERLRLKAAIIAPHSSRSQAPSGLPQE
jgi:hypothetical protein